MDLGYMNVVYFDLQMGYLQAVCWLKSSFGRLTPFSVTNALFFAIYLLVVYLMCTTHAGPSLPVVSNPNPIAGKL